MNTHNQLVWALLSSAPTSVAQDVSWTVPHPFRHLPFHIDTLRFIQWAHDNYDNGGDRYVECYSSDEISSSLYEVRGFDNLVTIATIIQEVMEDRRLDAINSAF